MIPSRRLALALVTLLLAFTAGCQPHQAAEPQTGAAQPGVAASAPAQSASGATYSNPVIAGDFPDPSVIRVGNEFWATTTTSEWGPPFMLLRSTDLVNWEITGTVFSERPKWAEGNFWASEISQHGGKFFIYFTARKKGASLCLASATAAQPQGPYTDHGPMVCQDAGSIDAFPFTGNDGKRYMVWKEDGNSRNLPTPLWAQPLDATGTRLVGERKEILRNTEKWEGQLVEGPSLMRRGEWIYMFYAGAACCGRECNYAAGVARAKDLFGPWEKNPNNPILRGNDVWKCPGHGTPVSLADGRDYFMYHAYSAKDTVYVGRQAMLDLITWGSDGWPTINAGRGPSVQAASPLGAAEGNAEYAFTDDFSGPALQPGWQWPQEQRPTLKLADGRVTLTAAGARDPYVAAVLAHPIAHGQFVATATLAPGANVDGGISAVGDLENAVGLALRKGRAELWSRQKKNTRIEKNLPYPVNGPVELRVTAADGHTFRFALRSGNGAWMELGDLDGTHLPPWDRGVRIALVSGSSASFDAFALQPAQAAAGSR